ncbi:hypothetical protein KBI23_23635 [bacterium]|nr:hypothetical protein [bacterium]MBP9810206.1 hypothetical protein [bacterium]
MEVTENNSREPTASSCADAGRSTMAVHLSGAGLEMTIDTAIDHSLEIVCLGAKLELTTQMLSDTSRRLEAAMLRIGQLEAELHASLNHASLNQVGLEQARSGGSQANG